jgi:glycerate kinase
MTERQVLVAPASFGAGLRAPAAAAAIARGLEAAGLRPPDLCPVGEGGDDTVELLAPRLGGETADGFALVDGGATALVLPADDPRTTADRLVAAAAAGAARLVLAAADADAARVVAALGAISWPVLVLRGPAAGDDDAVAPPARLERGARFVLDALDVDDRLRAARAVIVGGGRLDQRALEGGVVGELAVRARQAGVPCHAVVGELALDAFAARMLDLQRIVEAPDAQALAASGAALADVL